MKAIITLRNSFWKRTCLSNSPDIAGSVSLSNGKELELYFILEKDVIEVTHLEDKLYKEPLSEEERISIIEEILVEYATLFKSTLHASINLKIENYSMIDTTNMDADNEMDIMQLCTSRTILEEYLDSEYSKSSENNMLRNLKAAYDFLTNNYDFLGVCTINIELDSKLNFEERNDIKYFLSYIFKDFDVDNKVKVKIYKNENYLSVIPIEEELD